MSDFNLCKPGCKSLSWFPSGQPGCSTWCQRLSMNSRGEPYKHHECLAKSETRRIGKIESAFSESFDSRTL